MRALYIGADGVVALEALPSVLPLEGFLWIGCERPAFEAEAPALQAALLRWDCGALVDLHVSDLLNAQLPSNFDYTSWYDLLVFRRLAASTPEPGNGTNGNHGGNGAAAGAAQPAPALVDTSPVGFAVYDRVLITVHPPQCPVRAYFERRLGAPGGVRERGGPRLPTSPADLMLRMVNHIVDSYLDLRRLLTRQLGALQQALLHPRSRFHDWQVLLDARNALHLLEDTCEDQRAAMQEWIDGLEEQPPHETHLAREFELLRVRSRDVLEHIERVLSHVRRLQQSAETAVQMHFSAIGHRTNDIMRTLTVLTAIFLPLNLITGFFGMNFDALPLIHTSTGVWIAVALMATLGLGLGWFFWRKRYLGTQRR
ncbi:magnesium transporter CorA family protein [Azohydromonas caseinilytica]|uniref:Magnesium transporter CorA family protein n=1 Tax=Azohydromonas caseinilytica TaxID=2728836 RepID=A0A848FL23_9BURK|nr:magnesium transporter CorA family protein [Azohydromonas caseinilytica]NML18960.1 magnesium transporter CorA family protein [Azohydromonas caseinilytica]